MIVNFYDVVIHHERPMPIDVAKKVYGNYINKYFLNPGHGTMIGGTGDISDSMIKEKTKQWINRPDFLSWFFSFRCTSRQGGFVIELMHSSIS